ncbi:Hypothetical predicted protein [Prunus dulcis]|uniref:Uncharacterized protein n=1 Tax=Prunus dulcis TaxID=3755 RepID=A0A5E4G7C1_PRUDU|nr:hypothetical protein L3X38_037095 [Prunus dulcis]VVA35500.1 Hypothetical predicted protein [Prunus dulcis]
MVAIRPPVPPTPLEENEVGREYESEKEVDETTLKLNIQGDLPIENLTLVEEKESTQRDEIEEAVNIEDGNIIQLKATILGCNGLQASEREVILILQPIASEMARSVLGIRRAPSVELKIEFRWSKMNGALTSATEVEACDLWAKDDLGACAPPK